ncbi:MAG: YbaB/EbfC family nucleoid-associated protein [bacterium]|nr:YbaB/EbfC family nucleoid-associated protein [bacterium]
MNMQKLMKEAQKMQKEILEVQEKLNETVYEGVSSLVSVVVNGKKELIKVEIKDKDTIENDDIELLEDMIIVAVNDAMRKIDEDKEQKMSKYGQGFSGLM